MGERTSTALLQGHLYHPYLQMEREWTCDNHCGISLDLISGEILVRVLLNPLSNHLEHGLLPESQCGFLMERGIFDMVFAPRQQQETCPEQNTDLNSTYVYLTKAFNTDSRDGPWRIMAKCG